MQKRIREKSRFNLNSVSPSLSNPISATGISGGFSTLSSVGKKIIALLLGLLIVSSGLFVYNMQTAQAANAGAFEDWTCDNFKNGIYKDYGWGTTATLPAPGITDALNVIGSNETSGKRTAYEVYGTAGLGFTMWRSVDRENLDAKQEFTYTYANGGDPVKLSADKTSPYWANDFMECTGATGFLGNGIANVLFMGSAVGVTIINFVYGVAVDSSSIVQPFYDEIDKIIAALESSLYTPFITLIIMLGALWMAWIGLVKKRSTEAFQGALWMIGAAIVGGILFLNPSFIPKTANNIVGAFTETISATITNNSTSNVNQALCSVNGDMNTTDESGNPVAISKDSRVMQCAIWYNILYTPWVVGQFGASPNGTSDKDKAIMGGGSSGENGLTADTAAMVDRINISLGSDNELSNDQKTWPLIQLNAQALSDNVYKLDGSKAKYEYVMGSASAVAYQQLVVNDSSTWKGMDPWSRISIASTSNIAMIATGIIVIMFGGMIMIYEFATIFLVLIMPLFLLIGVHPGFGRRVALRWLEMLANFTIKRILATILLALFIMLYAMVMGMQTNWLSQNLLIVIITVVGLKYKGSIMNAFADVNFGGDRNALTPDPKGGSSFGKKVFGAAVGAVAGTLGANAILKTLAPAAASAVVGGGDTPVLEAGGAGPTPEGPTPAGGGTGPTSGGGGGTGPTAGGGSGPTAGDGSSDGPTAGGGGTGAPIEPTPSGGAPTPLGSGPTAIPVPITPNTSYGPKPEAKPKAKPKNGAPALPPRSPEDAEKKRIDDLRKSTVRKAAMQGALQGFSGNMQSAVLGASLTGMQMGDNIHDNEINRQENEKRDRRDQERTALMREQMDASAQSQTRLADMEQSRFNREQERMYYEAGLENERRDQEKFNADPYTRPDNFQPVDEPSNNEPFDYSDYSNPNSGPKPESTTKPKPNPNPFSSGKDPFNTKKPNGL